VVQAPLVPQVAFEVLLGGKFKAEKLMKDPINQGLRKMLPMWYRTPILY
jgi:hypothetical protein